MFFFILKTFCSTLNSWMGELENSFFDVTNRLLVTVHYWKSGRKTYINQQCHLHNATWGKHRHFYDCIFMIFTLQLENYNCKIHSLARSNILLHLIQIWSGIWITKQITTQLSSIFLIMCRQYPYQPQCWNDLLLFSIDCNCILHIS